MNRRLWRRAMALTLVTAMTAGLAACGGGSGSNGGGSTSSKGEQHYFKATYLSDLPENFNDNVNRVTFKGDVMYYGSYDDNYDSYGIYSYNIVTKETATLYTQGEDENSNDGSYSSVSDFAVGEDGSVYLMLYNSVVDESSLGDKYDNATLDDVLQFLQNDWGYSEEDAQSTWDDAYAGTYTDENGNVDYRGFLISMNAPRINTQTLTKMDSSGKEVFAVDMGEENASGSTNISCNGLAADGDGNLYAAMNVWDDSSDEYFIALYDKDGNGKGKVTLDGYSSSLVKLGDGSVATISWGNDGGNVMTPIDFASGKLKTDAQVKVPSDSVVVLDDKNVLMTESTSVYKYNIDTQEKELYFNWMDCNISSSTVSSYSLLSDGTIAAFIQNWRSNGNNSEVAIVKEVDKSEIGDVKNLVLASMWADSNLEEKIIDFNKKQDQYHITMKTYDSDSNEDWQDTINNFTTAVTTDPDIDIVMFYDYSQVLSFAGKGLNIDLYDLIDKDPDLSRDDFLPNILTACEYDGKLAFLPTGFSLQTLIGKADDVGTTPGWTLDDVKALLASKPEGTQLLYGMDRTAAMDFCMNLGYNDFIDWEAGTCNFDSQEFVDILEFAATFPEQFEYNDDGEDTSVLLNTGRQLLDSYYLSDFNQVQLYRVIFGGNTTFIGYPTTNGNGALLNFSNILGISKNCDDVDGAWQFLRTMYLPTKDGENNYTYDFSIRKDSFEKYCKDAMDEEKNGGGGYGWGEFNVEIKAATQEDVDQVKDLVYNTTAVSGAGSSDINNIISEESEAFFTGQKSASDVAKIIQSRVKVYLSETK